jgi:hypothetical protein
MHLCLKVGYLGSKVGYVDSKGTNAVKIKRLFIKQLQKKLLTRTFIYSYFTSSPPLTLSRHLFSLGKNFFCNLTSRNSTHRLRTHPRSDSDIFPTFLPFRESCGRPDVSLNAKTSGNGSVLDTTVLPVC